MTNASNPTGRSESIHYAAKKTRFGWIAAGAAERGLCWLALASSRAEAEASLRQTFPEAKLSRDPTLEAEIDAAVASVEGESAVPAAPLDLRGTAFQLKVWRALCKIPRGQTRSYSQFAKELGRPTAVRAVARACAANRVALLVPCHRVVGASGALTGYRWGVERKRQLLAAEAAAVALR